MSPTCGHDDGWCGGVLGNNTCTRRVRPRLDDLAEHGTDPSTLLADRAERRGVASDDFYERAGTWSRD